MLSHVRISFFFQPENTPMSLSATFCLSILLLIGICVVSTSWLLWIMLGILVNKYLFELLLSILLSIYLEVDLLDHMVILFLIFWGTAILFLTVVAPFYIPNSIAQEFWFLHIPTSTFLSFSLLSLPHSLFLLPSFSFSLFFSLI